MKKLNFITSIALAAVILCSCSAQGKKPVSSGDPPTEPVPTSDGSVTEEFPDDAEENAMPGYDRLLSIIDDYAKFSGARPSNVTVLRYYGSYSAGEAVLPVETDKGYTADIYSFEVAGYEFELASGEYRIYIHLKDGTFAELSEAYENGLMSDEDIASVWNYYNNPGSAAMPSLSPESLSEEAQALLVSDYAEYAQNTLGWGQVSASGIYVMYYFCSVDGAEAVVMASSDMMYTDDIKNVEVAGLTFSLPSSGLDIMLHKDGTFIELSEAYSQEMISDDDVAKLYIFARRCIPAMG